MQSCRCWVRLVAAVLLVQGAACEELHVVGSSVCLFTPADTQSPTSVQCDIRGNTININAADLQASIQELVITNASLIEVLDSALSHLQNLTTVHFSASDRLLMRPNSVAGAASRTTDVATSVTIDDVRDVAILKDVFSGWQHESVNLSVSDVKTCTIVGKAFPVGSTLGSVKLENIENLSIDTDSFAAVIDDLELRNVSSSYTCRTDTFSGDIGRLSLDAVTLNRIAPGCFRASYPWLSLDIRSSSFGSIPPQGFTGDIGHVRIADTKISNISAGGFDLNVTSFTMEGCVISSLSGHGLQVAAEDVITLSMWNVSRLGGDAFGGLLSHNISSYPVTVSHMAVGEAAAGALRFANWSSVVLRNILLSERCLCSNITRRAAQLALGPQRTLSGLSEDELGAVRRVAFATRCRDAPGTAFMAQFFCQRCRGRSAAPGVEGDAGERSTEDGGRVNPAEGSGGGDSTEDAGGGDSAEGSGGDSDAPEIDPLLWCPLPDLPPGGRGWLMWPLAFILLLLVLMAGCGPLLIARRCRRPGSWWSRKGRHRLAKTTAVQPAPDHGLEKGQDSGVTALKDTGTDIGQDRHLAVESGEGIPQDADDALKAVGDPRERHVSWRVVGELGPDYDDILTPSEILAKKAVSPKARHVSWRVVGELEPEYPEYAEVVVPASVAADVLLEDPDVAETWRPGKLLPLDELSTEPDYDEVVTPSEDLGRSRSQSDFTYGDVFQSLHSISEPVAEFHVETTPPTVPRTAQGDGLKDNELYGRVMHHGLTNTRDRNM